MASKWKLVHPKELQKWIRRWRTKGLGYERRFNVQIHL